MYAIVALGGKQYHCEAGKLVDVELTEELKKVAEGGTIKLDRVLLVSQTGSSQIGTPVVSGAFVQATVVAFDKADKIRVEVYKKRKNYKRTYGHRQPYVRLKIDQIQAG